MSYNFNLGIKSFGLWNTFSIPYGKPSNQTSDKTSSKKDILIVVPPAHLEFKVTLCLVKLRTMKLEE